MADTLIKINKQKAVVEDIEFGVSQVSQERNGVVNIYNRVNASHIPTVHTGESVQDILDGIGETYTSEQINELFAPINGDQYNWFAVRNAVEDFQAVSLYQLRNALDEVESTSTSDGIAKAGYLVELNQLGKLDSSLNNIATQTDMEGGLDSTALVSAGSLFPVSVNSIINARATNTLDMVNGIDSYVKTSSNGKISDSLLNFTALTLVATWQPQAGTEYPSDTTDGNTYLIDAVGAGYTFTGGDLNGLTTYNGDVIVRSVAGWSISPQNVANSEFYNVLGSVPLQAKLASAGYGISNSGDIIGAAVDAESAGTPKLTGYVLAGASNTIIQKGSNTQDFIPSASDIVQLELFVNQKDRNIYTLDDTDTPIFVGGHTSKDSELLNGVAGSGYALINGNAGEIFEVLPGSNDSDAVNLLQVNQLIASGVPSTGNDLYVPKTRTVNGKELSNDILLNYQDVNAMPSDASVNDKKFSDHANSIVINYTDVQAAPLTHVNTMATDTVPGHIKISCENGRLDIWTV